MTKYAIVTRAVLLSAILSLIGLAPAAAQIAPLEEALSEKVIGSADAPVTLHEYASLTCPHCAKFHTEILPQIKAGFVDSGKLKIVYHDFPLDNLALAASMVARCAGNERYFEFLDMLNETQETWARADNPFNALVAVARFGGLAQADVEACLANEPLQQAIVGTATDKEPELRAQGMQGTPFFVLDGKGIPGAMDYADFKSLIEDALAAKGVH